MGMNKGILHMFEPPQTPRVGMNIVEASCSCKGGHVLSLQSEIQQPRLSMDMRMDRELYFKTTNQSIISEWNSSRAVKFNVCQVTPLVAINIRMFSGASSAMFLSCLTGQTLARVPKALGDP